MRKKLWIGLILINLSLTSCTNLKKVVLSDEEVFVEFAQELYAEDFDIARLRDGKIEFNRLIMTNKNVKEFKFSHTKDYEEKYSEILNKSFRIFKIDNCIFFAESGTISGWYCGIAYAPDDEISFRGLKKLEKLYSKCYYFEGYI